MEHIWPPQYLTKYMTPPADRSFYFQPPQYITKKISDPPEYNQPPPPPKPVINDLSLTVKIFITGSF